MSNPESPSSGRLGAVRVPPAVLTAAAVAVLAALVLVTATGVKLAAEPSSTPRLDWLFNGELFDSAVVGTARVGNTLYVGGTFTSAAPSSGVLSRFFQLSPATGAPVPGLPAVNGPVTDITLDGAGGYYIAGYFTNIGSAGLATGGFPSMRFAHVLANGSDDVAFRPQFGGHFIDEAVRVGPSLVVRGSLFINGGTTQRQLLAVDPATGTLLPWVPVLPGARVDDIAALGSTLFVLNMDTAGQSRVSAFDAASGAPLWNSQVLPTSGIVGFGGRLAASGSRVIVGLTRLYALDVATGIVDAGWGGPEGAPDSWTSAVAINGSTIYVGGRFATFHGQPRANLAAVDLATGALLSWAPQASTAIDNLVVSGSGSVFVTSTTNTPLAVNGQSRPSRTAEIDVSGVVTPWVSQALFFSAALQVSQAGTLVFGSGTVPTVGNVAFSGLAGFDITSGAAVPGTPVVGNSAGVAGVRSVVAAGQTLFMSGYFDQVNGVPRAGLAAVDATTNTVLPWPTAGVAGMSLAFVEGPWIYGYQVSGDLRRVHTASGVLDPVFRVVAAYGTQSVVANRGELVSAIRAPLFPNVPIPPTLVGVLDPVTGAFVERFRIPILIESVDTLTIDGDTLYFAGPARGAQATVGVLRAFHRTSGVPVSVPPVTGQFNGLVVADGRLLAYGGLMRLGGTLRLGIAELARPGAFTGFDAGAWLPDGGLQITRRGVLSVQVLGDHLVAFGLGVVGDRVAAFPLAGASVPSGLRSQTVGPNTVFSWDATVPPPAGGYVIEGGFAAGQTAGALAVGNATSVALPMPAGPLFIRVRPQGSTEVSNEIVAGCVAPPLPPTALTTTLVGTMLTLAWTPPAAAVTSYTLLAGTAAGLSNVVTLPLGPQASVSGTVPGGTFFARVTATNACGTSGPSGEVFFTIGAPDPLPAAPTNLAASVSGSTVSLTWTAPAGAVTSYVLEAGTGAGLANLGTLAIGATPSLVVPGVPAGTYVLRVRAVTSAGSGAPSADVVVVVVVQ